jgi:hypothetical protein
MNEPTKTFFFCLVAGALVAAAMMVDPGAVTPKIFSDQGQPFYPGFTDPQAPKVIEVIDYDEATATARPLKVEFRNKKWTIPSHYGYPADAEDRLAKTAAALMELRKDSIVSDRVEDHAKYGVIDPVDQNASSLTGRGKRVTLKDGKDMILSDFIVGKPAEGKTGYYYIRVPNQRRTYLVKSDAEVSAKFQDWIETDLLKLAAAEIRKIIINNYSINETLGILENVESMTLLKNKDQWTISGDGLPRKDKTDELTGALANLRIVDVQPKPMGLSHDLKTPEGIRLSPESMLSLRHKGFFVTPAGQLLSNAGDLSLEAANGLQYTLRFGEIAPGGASPAADIEPAAKEGTAAKETQDRKDNKDSKEAPKNLSERRYLFIMVSYNPDRVRQYAEGREPSGKGKELERELRDRFADWYYIISGADFNKLRPHKKDLMKGKS